MDVTENKSLQPPTHRSTGPTDMTWKGPHSFALYRIRFIAQDGGNVLCYVCLSDSWGTGTEYELSEYFATVLSRGNSWLEMWEDLLRWFFNDEGKTQDQEYRWVVVEAGIALARERGLWPLFDFNFGIVKIVCDWFPEDSRVEYLLYCEEEWDQLPAELKEVYRVQQPRQKVIQGTSTASPIILRDFGEACRGRLSYIAKRRQQQLRRPNDNLAASDERTVNALEVTQIAEVEESPAPAWIANNAPAVIDNAISVVEEDETPDFWSGPPSGFKILMEGLCDTRHVGLWGTIKKPKSIKGEPDPQALLLGSLSKLVHLIDELEKQGYILPGSDEAIARFFAHAYLRNGKMNVVRLSAGMISRRRSGTKANAKRYQVDGDFRKDLASIIAKLKERNKK